MKGEAYFLSSEDNLKIPDFLGGEVGWGFICV